MDAMVKVFGPMFNIPWLPRFILRSYTSIKIPATRNGDIAAKFAGGKTKLRPIIFSHGLSGDKTFYTGVYHALAAQGYMVLAVNHQDESCFFTEDKYGNEIGYVLKPFYFESYRKQQLKIRVDEITKTAEALKEMSYDLHLDLFGAAFPNAKLDYGELVLAGHSFGAATVIATASQLRECE
jgi:predicted dienelactone hydrolase